MLHMGSRGTECVSICLQNTNLLKFVEAHDLVAPDTMEEFTCTRP